MTQRHRRYSERRRFRDDPEKLEHAVAAALGEAEHREQALEMLESLGYMPGPAPRLAELYRSSDPRLRRVAVNLAWLRDSAAAAVLREALWDEDPLVRDAAYGSCAQLLQEREPELTRRLLTCERAEIREDALAVLWTSPAGLGDVLRTLLSDPSPVVRGRAATVLAREAPWTPGIIDPLLAFASTSAGVERWNCLHGLARALAAQPSHQDGRAAFLGFLASADEGLRSDAAWAADALAPLDNALAGALFEVLTDPKLADAAAEALSQPGPATATLAPRLLALLRSATSSEDTRERVLKVLSRLGETGHLDELRQLIGMASGGPQPGNVDEVTGLAIVPGSMAIEWVRWLGVKAYPLLPDLIALIRSCPDEGVVRRACEALPFTGARGGEAEEAVVDAFRRFGAPWPLASVIADLGARSEDGLLLVLRASARSAHALEPDFHTAFAALGRAEPDLQRRLEAVRVAHPSLADQVARALEAIGVVDECTLGALLSQLLRGTDPDRQRAIARIRTLGSRAAALLGPALDALDHEIGEARKALLEILGPISGGALTDRARVAIDGALASDDPEVVAVASATLEELAGRGVTEDEEEGDVTFVSMRHLTRSLLQLVGSDRQNVVFSPTSVHRALVVLWHAARGETRRQLEAALGSAGDPEMLWKDSLALHERLSARSGAFTLSERAAIFTQEGWPIAQAFLDDLRLASIAHEPVDFRCDPSGAAAAINAWGARETGGRLAHLVSTPHPQTRFACVTTTCVLARWEKPFSDETAPAPFFLLDDTQVEVPTMLRKGGFRHARGSRFDLVEIPYKEGLADMFVVAPDRGFFSRVHATFTLREVEALENQLESDSRALLRLPKFKFSSTIELNEALARLGFAQLLGGDLDLSGMVSAPEPLFGEVAQQAVIDVNEKGTQAFAATLVRMIAGVPRNVDVNRPFIFVLRHRETKVPLFVGTVVDPRGLG